MIRTDYGSKVSRFGRGELESVGLAEVAHFLRKAKQNIEHARFALDNTDFSVVSEMLSPAQNKVAEISALIVEMRRCIEVAEVNIVSHIETAQEETEAEGKED